ncbi:MAG: hypothetical protein HC848_01260, partial [Limnobacter sp.]|nr:hypothetical protein [Limnobacter sp.]
MKLKITLWAPVAYVLVALSACDDSETVPATPELRASKMTTTFTNGQQERILHYDVAGKVTSITSRSTYNNVTEVSEQALEYVNGRLSRLNVSEEQQWYVDYFYDDAGKLAGVNLFIGDALTEQTLYEYDGNKVIARIAYQDVDGEGPLDPVFKAEYTYAGNNLATLDQYGHNGTDYVFISTLAYSDFDNKINASDAFLNDVYMPNVQLFENNPQSVSVTNPHGHTTTQAYTFEYNERGYAVKQTAVGYKTFV